MLILSLLEDITLPRRERLEHVQLQQALESFALAAKGETTLEESPVNLARSLFVQICRMSLSRGRRAVFLEKADEIERKACLIPYVASLYLERDELQLIHDAIDSEIFERYGLAVDASDPLEQVRQKLNRLLLKLEKTQSL